MFDIPLHFLDIPRRADEARSPFVHPLGFQIQQILLPVRRHAASGANNMRHWTGLVQELQISVRVAARVARIHE